MAKDMHHTKIQVSVACSAMKSIAAQGKRRRDSSKLAISNLGYTNILLPYLHLSLRCRSFSLSQSHVADNHTSHPNIKYPSLSHTPDHIETHGPQQQSLGQQVSWSVNIPNPAKVFQSSRMRKMSSTVIFLPVLEYTMTIRAFALVVAIVVLATIQVKAHAAFLPWWKSQCAMPRSHRRQGDLSVHGIQIVKAMLHPRPASPCQVRGRADDIPLRQRLGCTDARLPVHLLELRGHPGADAARNLGVWDAREARICVQQDVADENMRACIP